METVNFENENVIMKISDGILYLKYKKSILDLDTAKDVVNQRHILSKRINYPLFTDISEVKVTTKEARAWSSHGDAAMYVSASALVGSSELTKVMANFFLAINKPAVPVKFFSDETKALQWLEQFKDR